MSLKHTASSFFHVQISLLYWHWSTYKMQSIWDFYISIIFSIVKRALFASSRNQMLRIMMS